ncbi:MAG TPA: hypothetical protein VMW69_16640 [Spirochaetia bacterium]|nr:hypothetical protein [Spirochaetia bacterium]
MRDYSHRLSDSRAVGEHQEHFNTGRRRDLISFSTFCAMPVAAAATAMLS